MLKFFKRRSANTASNFDKMETVDIKLTKRQMLIKNALEIHKTQSKLLENLDDETKNRLKTFAKKNFFKIKGKD